MLGLPNESERTTVTSPSAILRDSDTASAEVDFLLKTELRSLTKDNGRATSDYLQYAFQLERPRDGAVLWSGMYETKRVSAVDVIYQ